MIRPERRIRIARDYITRTEHRTALWTDEALLDLYEWMQRTVREVRDADTGDFVVKSLLELHLERRWNAGRHAKKVIPAAGADEHRPAVGLGGCKKRVCGSEQTKGLVDDRHRREVVKSGAQR